MAITVTGRFNVRDQMRKYSGNSRKYDEDAIKRMVESGATQERIALREALGYLGHGRREIGSMNPQEIEIIKTANGPLILENIPACVTKKLTYLGNGEVEHETEVLDTDAGKVIQALIKNKIGGFSWSVDGRDGGAFKPTEVDKFFGFDYVYQPNYSKNRPYDLKSTINESVGGESVTEEQKIFESIQESCGFDDERARMYARTITSPELLASDAIAMNERLAQDNAYLSEQLEDAQLKIADLMQQLETAKSLGANQAEMIKDWGGKLGFFVSDKITESVSNGDLGAGLDFIAECVKQQGKVSSLPVQSNRMKVTAHEWHSSNDQDGYGVNSAPEWD